MANSISWVENTKVESVQCFKAGCPIFRLLWPTLEELSWATRQIC